VFWVKITNQINFEEFKMLNIINRLCVFSILFVIAFPAWSEGPHMSISRKQGTFADVKEAVEMAITGRGLVINNVSHIGDMLARTGKDVGGTKQIYVQAEALEFCSASVSRNMMLTDPDNIVFCPYIIAIYVVPEKPGEVRVAYRKTQLVGSKESQRSLEAVNKLLSEIVEEAVQ
jgi:uncharacterized protein (DUF302 family)